METEVVIAEPAKPLKEPEPEDIKPQDTP